jgi:Ca-activated chloride channel homolog
MVTPATSLMVLETISQYVEHRIRPPESLTEFQKEYDETIAAMKHEEQQKEFEKIDQVKAMWKARIEWWNTEFTYPKDFKIDEKKQRYAEDAPSVVVQDSLLLQTLGTSNDERGSGSFGFGAGAINDVELESSLSGQSEGEVKKDKVGKKGTKQKQAAITLQEWNPQTPYLTEISSASKSDQYAVYLKQKEHYASSPAFYLDCADYFLNENERELSLRIVTNLAELQLSEPSLLRILGHRLKQLGELYLAQLVFEEVKRLRPEEPQSYRDLALVFAAQEKYEESLDLLAHVVLNDWDRFQEIELIALVEFNRLLPLAKNAGVSEFPLPDELIQLMDMDIRITLSWDADLTDIDLWVIEPSGEKAFYSNNRTHIGGLVSKDFTQGYGPETYLLHTAMPGEYKVQVNFYGSQAQKLSGAVTLQLDIYTNYGRENEEHQAIIVRLKETKEVLTIGTVLIE